MEIRSARCTMFLNLEDPLDEEGKPNGMSEKDLAKMNRNACRLNWNFRTQDIKYSIMTELSVVKM